MTEIVFDYSKPVTPKDYVCKGCGAKNCKLWADYPGMSKEKGLLCANCAETDQRRNHDANWVSPFKQGRGDQIGWRVPAVPFLDNSGYWPYMAVPEPGVKWWHSLPLTSQAS